MLKNKKILVACAAMLLSIVSLAGCDALNSLTITTVTTNTGSTGTQQSNGYDGSAQTIKFYHTMSTTNLTPVLDQYIEEFNQIYPNITIEWTSVGGYDDVRDQIKTEISIGEQPNIAYCYPDHVALYNKAKAVLTLDDFIASTESDSTENGIIGLTQAQIDDFIPGYWEEGKQFGDGKMYTLPFSKSTEVLYYNKTFFEANEIPVPDHWFSADANDTTSMEAVCDKIKTIDATSIPLGYDSDANWFITMCEQMNIPYTSATEPHFLFNNDQAKDFVKKFRNWYQSGYITTQAIYGTYTSALFVNQDNTNAKSYMSIGSSAGATHQRPTKVSGAYPFEVGIAQIPQHDASHKKVISQGPSVCIFKSGNTQKDLAAWLFVKFLTTNVGFQADFSLASGYVPVIKSVLENETYAARLESRDGGDNVAMLSAYQCMQQVDDYFTSPAFIGSSAARDEVGQLLPAVFTPETITDAKINELFQDAIDECEYQAG